MGYSTNFGGGGVCHCGSSSPVVSIALSFLSADFLEKYYIARNSHLQILPSSVGLTIPVERQNGLVEEIRQIQDNSNLWLHQFFYIIRSLTQIFKQVGFVSILFYQYTCMCIFFHTLLIFDELSYDLKV